MKEVKGFSVLLVVLLQLQIGSALGVLYWHSPQMNFEPGASFSLHYTIHGLDPEQVINISVTGDLSPYVEVTPKIMKGGGDFTATINLPHIIEKPGPHTLYFTAAEVVEEEVGIGTAVRIRIPFTIFVPYPGKYVEAVLKADDVNVGEPLDVKIDMSSLGNEQVTVKADLHISINGEQVNTLDLGSKTLESQEKNAFRKRIDTQGYKSGNYTIVAFLNYGPILRIEGSARIGDLSVNIINYTEKVAPNAINKFDIEVESQWNNEIEEIYGEVKVSNASSTLVIFKTPSEKLERWSKKTLTGFLDTRTMAPGEYSLVMMLFYDDHQSTKEGTLIIEDGKTSQTAIIVAGAIFLILLVTGGIIFIKKKKKGKKKRK